MAESRVASRYAKPLLELAQERGVLEEVHADMQLLTRTINEHRDLKLAMKNPIIKNDKKLTILNKVFGSRINPMTAKIFQIISQKNRENILEDIAREFEHQYNQLKGIQVAHVTTAIPLSTQLRSEFGKVLADQTGKTVDLKEHLDPNLIGGYVLRVGDRQLDDSVRNSLRRLRNQFKENPYIPKM
jgi:F-type H+-transporting ATPase subunit delta